MARIKNAARLRKINTAPSLSLSLSSDSVKYRDVPFHGAELKEREAKERQSFFNFSSPTKEEERHQDDLCGGQLIYDEFARRESWIRSIGDAAPRGSRNCRR